MKGNDVIYTYVLTSYKWCQMFSGHSNYNVKHTRHEIQCQKFMLVVVGRKSLVMLCRMGSQRGILLGLYVVCSW